MRVVQLITRRQRRGAEVFATELADELATRGHDVVVFSLYGAAGTPLEAERVEIREVGASDGLPLDPRTPGRLARAIRDFSPDVVQANGSDTLKYSVLARTLTRGAWPLVYRNISMASRWLRGPAHRRWNRWLAHRVDRVVAVSRVSADDFAESYGLPPERVVVIRQSVRIPDRTARSQARSTLLAMATVPDDARLLMHIGSFTPEKNHVWLVRQFGELAGRYPDLHLFLLGDGPQRAEVDRTVGELGLAERVHGLGSRPDASRLVAAADLLLLPSLVEGLPGVVLEAAAQGVPAVAADVGGVAEAVVDGETGVLVPPGDPESFRAAVSSLLEAPTRRKAMGERARARVEDEFSLADAVSSYERLYRSLAGDG